MEHVIYIALTILLAAGLLAATGWWRLAFALFGIRRAAMTVHRLGLHVSPPDVGRVESILQSFAGGFNAMIARPSGSAWQGCCDALPSLCRPFGHEGAAMGYCLRNLFRYRPGEFEDRMVRPQPGFRYLYYVGLGFWSGMRGHNPQRLAQVVDGLDPLHGYLCYDGYGFRYAFFDYLKDPQCLCRLDGLDGYAKNAAHQGVGRAFFFLFMGRPDLLIEHVGKLGEHAEDAAAGVGLAAVFVNPDRLATAQELGRKLPPQWHDCFHLGMCFGLKARSITDADQFDRDVARLEPDVQAAVRAAIRECDRAERQVRADGAEDGYRRWRGLVTQWMASHIQYPLAGVRSSVPDMLTREPASTQPLAVEDARSSQA